MLKGVEQIGRYRHKDVFDHTLMCWTMQDIDACRQWRRFFDVANRKPRVQTGHGLELSRS